MKPSGTVYQSNTSSITGDARIALTEKEKKNFKRIRFVAANVSSLALAFLLFFYGPPFELDLNYQAGLSRATAQIPQTEVVSPEQAVLDFSISIPKIGADSKIVPNIDAFDEAAYDIALKEGVVHAAGTGFPGQGKRIYLFAHSTSSPQFFTQFNAVFYQLRLLNKGDKIFVNFNSKVYGYEVVDKVVVEADNTSWLRGEGSGEELVLQTCDPPGTALRRLLVIAELTL
jgi:LPXTG-site transpeptidase (sortase) family protein